MNSPGAIPSAASAAVAHLAKSAIRGSEVSSTLGNSRGPALPLGDGRKRKYDRAVEEVGAGCDVDDAVQDRGAGGVEQGLLVISVELAGPEAPACVEPAEGVGELGRQPREIVEGDHPRVRSEER